ncbi:hypothetical protein [Amycolatopsis sp. NPDC051128]
MRSSGSFSTAVTLGWAISSHVARSTWPHAIVVFSTCAQPTSV